MLIPNRMDFPPEEYRCLKSALIAHPIDALANSTIEEALRIEGS